MSGKPPSIRNRGLILLTPCKFGRELGLLRFHQTAKTCQESIAAREAGKMDGFVGFSVGNLIGIREVATSLS